MPEIFGAALMGGGGKVFAVIDITYPIGATCTCSSGSKVLTAPNTTGHWLAVIPTAGDWTVTITQSGKQPASQIVNVTESKAYNLQMYFELVLYDNGYIPDGVIWQGIAWEPGYLTKGTFKLESDHIALSVAKTSIAASPSEAIDVTDYKTLYATVKTTTNFKDRAYLCLRNSLSPGWNFSAGATAINGPMDGVISVDITDVSGVYYPSIVMWSVGTDYPYSLAVYKVYIE